MSTLTTVAYDRSYRQTLLNLLYESYRTHSHLDWQRPIGWLDHDDHLIRLALQDDVLMGFIGMSTPLYGKSWLRLAAFPIAANIPVFAKALWDDLLPALHARGTEEVYVLVIDRWIEPIIRDLGFMYVEDVVTLHRMSQRLPSGLELPRIGIELAYIEDAEEILHVDHIAFPPPWQMTRDEMRLALRSHANSAIARHHNRIVGYQISTRHQTSGHLARLAVHPDFQGQRIGAALLDYLLANFARRFIHSVTVNTQQSNWRSQRLYQHYGFRRNGFDLAVWRMQL